MCFSLDDQRIPNYFEIAKKQGLKFHFQVNETETDIYPNTVDIDMVNTEGQKMSVRGESVGGGKIRISRINQVEVNFSGEYSTLIVIHYDKPGVIAHITKCLSDQNVNIAFMKLFRTAKGQMAYSIVESDGILPEGVTGAIRKNPFVQEVMLIQKQQLS